MNSLSKSSFSSSTQTVRLNLYCGLTVEVSSFPLEDVTLLDEAGDILHMNTGGHTYILCNDTHFLC